VIAGHETPELVFSTLAALKAERNHATNEAHRAAVDQQIAIFQREADKITKQEKARIKAESEARLRNAETGLSWGR
jgi:hypothetical protein